MTINLQYEVHTYAHVSYALQSLRSTYMIAYNYMVKCAYYYDSTSFHIIPMSFTALTHDLPEASFVSVIFFHDSTA